MINNQVPLPAESAYLAYKNVKYSSYRKDMTRTLCHSSIHRQPKTESSRELHDYHAIHLQMCIMDSLSFLSSH